MPFSLSFVVIQKNHLSNLFEISVDISFSLSLSASYDGFEVMPLDLKAF